MAMWSVFLTLQLHAIQAHFLQGPVPQGSGWDAFWADDLRDMDVPIQLDVQGGLPTWIRGSLIRNGPSQFTSPHRNVTFAYDGLAKLFKFELQGGQVRYQEKFLRTECFNLTRAKGAFPKGPMMGPTVPSFSAFEPPSKGIDNVNTQAWQLMGDKVGLATTDSAKIGMFDPTTLDLVEMLSYPVHGPMDAILLSATHPHFMPGSGRSKLVNVVSQLLGVGKHKLTVYQMGSDHVQVPFGQVTVPYMPYIHSFGVTEEAMLLVAYPLSFQEMCVLQFKPLIDCLKWLDQNVTIFVFPFNGTADAKPAMTITAPSHFSMHHVNSYADSEAFYMDIAGYADGGVFKSKYIHGELKVMVDHDERNHVPQWAAYRRLRIDRVSGSVDMIDIQLMDADGSVYMFDFPFINPDYDAKKHCVMWAVSSYAGNSTEYSSWAIIRTDLCTTSKVNTKAWQVTDHYPSEAIFVPRPGAKAEDDGLLLAQVLDGPKSTSYLLVLDAHSLEEVARASLPTGWATPYSQHGTWFSVPEEVEALLV